MTIVEKIELQRSARLLRDVSENLQRLAPTIATRASALSRECETKLVELERRPEISASRCPTPCNCAECSP